MYKIEIYEDKNGKCEIRDYMHLLQEKTDKDSKIKFRKITAYMRMLSEKGFMLGSQYIKYLSNDIWELRPLRDRILFAYVEENKFILLSIFMKKTQKTPKRELKKAVMLLKDYKERRGKNE